MRSVTQFSSETLQHNINILSTPHASSFYLDQKQQLQIDRRWFFQRWFSQDNSSQDKISTVALKTLCFVIQSLENGSLDKNKITQHHETWIDNRTFVLNILRNLSPEPFTYEYFAGEQIGGVRKADNELTLLQLNYKKIGVALQMLEDGPEYYREATSHREYEIPDGSSTNDVMTWLSLNFDSL